MESSGRPLLWHCVDGEEGQDGSGGRREREQPGHCLQKENKAFFGTNLHTPLAGGHRFDGMDASLLPAKDFIPWPLKHPPLPKTTNASRRRRLRRRRQALVRSLPRVVVVDSADDAFVRTNGHADREGEDAYALLLCTGGKNRRKCAGVLLCV